MHAGATVLTPSCFCFWYYVVEMRSWSTFPALNRWVFPDLNGEWEMTISEEENCRTHKLVSSLCASHIKQDSADQ